MEEAACRAIISARRRYWPEGIQAGMSLVCDTCVGYLIFWVVVKGRPKGSVHILETTIGDYGTGTPFAVVVAVFLNLEPVFLERQNLVEIVPKY